MQQYRVRYYDRSTTFTLGEEEIRIQSSRNVLKKEAFTIPNESISSKTGLLEENDRGYIHNIRSLMIIGFILSLLAGLGGVLIGQGFGWGPKLAALLCLSIYFCAPLLSPRRQGTILYSTAGIPLIQIMGKHGFRGREEYSNFIAKLDKWLSQ
ncbi:hypothetical protein [Puniceicoccus vermicola]|uniref:Uncharacterized protein n=1 Tax=Puniceicoccus vermicola TaxID=388746 RepID=A0A7X1E4U0_9BACT|nr:hypothetical protein [Puniceicoccus vermicola]MBC2602419.1 hypothetical protein [Puniceicoccus vermicola]